MWGNLILNTQIGKLQREQTKCLNLVNSQLPFKSLKILSICDLIKLENVKFGYKLVNGMLPTKIELCTQTDAKGKSLKKVHTYATRQKQLPNLPRVQTTQYLNSVFCNGIKNYNVLPN